MHVKSYYCKLKMAINEQLSKTGNGDTAEQRGQPVRRTYRVDPYGDVYLKRATEEQRFGRHPALQ